MAGFAIVDVLVREVLSNQPFITCGKVIAEPEHSEGITRNITFSKWNLA